MRLPQDRSTRIKSWVYITASFILSITWILSLAILTQKGGIDGRTAWVFGLCFITIPLMIYISMTPLWSRAVRFYSPHAVACIDSILAILWLSAWASLASYITAGKSHGTDAKKSGCDNFKFGSATKCQLAEANIIFGFLIMAAFCITTFFSFKIVMEYKRTGILPNRLGKGNISYPVKHFAEEDAFDASMDTAAPSAGPGGYELDAQGAQGGYPRAQQLHGEFDAAPVVADGPLNRF